MHLQMADHPVVVMKRL